MSLSVKFAGTVVARPDVRYTPNGVAVADITVAINDSVPNPQGEGYVDESMFIDVTVWRGRATAAAEHLGKGSVIEVEGYLKGKRVERNNGNGLLLVPRTYSRNNGEPGASWEVNARSIKYLRTNKPNGGGQAGSPPMPGETEDIPF